MRLAILIVLIGLTGCINQKEEGNFEINGMLKNAVEQEFYFQEWAGNSYKDIDTGLISADGNVELISQIEEPSYYRLDFGLERYVYIIGSPNEKIQINADFNNIEGTYTLSGSPESTLLREYLMGEYQWVAFQDSIKQILEIHKNNNDWGSYGVALMDKRVVEEAYYDSVRSFISLHPGAYASRVAISKLDPETDLDHYEMVRDAIKGKVPQDDPYLSELTAKIKEYKALAIGEVAPILSFAGVDGTPQSTADLRGQYVLIDFWASWCRPCRDENPNLVRLYNKYKDEGFEIYGYSLDQNKLAWESAINKDGLPWVHASDLQGWNAAGAATYKVYSIPMSYLLDPEGRIIAKGLRGAELAAKLAEIFDYGVREAA